MNRLGKKCAIFSASLHGLLVLILLFGAALMPNPDDKADFKPVTVYSSDKVSDLLKTDGGEAGAAPAPTPPAPQAKPVTAPAPQPRPEPPALKPVVRQVEAQRPLPVPKHLDVPKDLPALPKPKVVEPNQEHWYNPMSWNHPKAKPAKDEDTDDKPKTPHRIVLDPKDLRKTSRDSNERSTADAAAASADHRRRVKQLRGVYKDIAKNLLSEPSVKTDIATGVGGGGEAVANYNDIILSKYYNAWIVPTDLDDSTPSVRVSVTISRTGDVISATILSSSGNRALDRSIQSALDNVTFIEPFPPGSRDKERTVTIKFNTQAKRQLG